MKSVRKETEKTEEQAEKCGKRGEKEVLRARESILEGRKERNVHCPPISGAPGTPTLRKRTAQLYVSTTNIKH